MFMIYSLYRMMGTKVIPHDKVCVFVTGFYFKVLHFVVVYLFSVILCLFASLLNFLTCMLCVCVCVCVCVRVCVCISGVVMVILIES